MNLTPEQLAKCRAEFENIYKGPFLGKNNYGRYFSQAMQDKFEGFLAAWRPRLSAEEIEAELDLQLGQDYGDTWSRVMAKAAAQVIYRAQGGEDE